jgi:hypothetical protein
VNQKIRELLCSSVSLTRTAELLRLNPKTVVRKAIFLGIQAKLAERERILALSDGVISEAQFDEMQTAEHTKCKPVSLPLLVHPGTRQILGIEVASMPATGKLAEIARRKYPPRRDERAEKGQKVLRVLERIAPPNIPILSDQWPTYPHWIKAVLPTAVHHTVKGKRGCVVGMGELKKTGFDPLFSLNHTAAMFRANVNRLHRRTWCTTKKLDRLELHLWLYVNFHNETRIEEIGMNRAVGRIATPALHRSAA